MGASGSGKTTLLETMVGLRPLSSGQVRVLGRRVFAGSHPDLGSRIVLLGQQPFFLPVSIAENLRLANPAASRGELEPALALACADGFVTPCPDGVEARLDLGGSGRVGR